MSTPSPAKAGHGVEEEERGTGPTLVKVGRWVDGEEKRGTGTTPVKIGPRVEEERGKATTAVKVKAEPGGDGRSLINIKVHSQTAADEFFHVMRDVKLRRLIDMYCSKHSLNPEAVVFMGPCGRYITADQTPEEARLEDGDAIDIFLHQLGGTGVPV